MLICFLLACMLQRALVFSFDGGGNDGSWHIFHFDRSKEQAGVNHLEEINVNLGHACCVVFVHASVGISYGAFGAIIPEVAGNRSPPSQELLLACDICSAKPFWNVISLNLAGKLMVCSSLVVCSRAVVVGLFCVG